jgi:hypothetical protein
LANIADRVAKGRSATGDRNFLSRYPLALRVRGEQHGQTRLSADQVREMRARFASGVRTAALARVYGVSDTTVHRIVHRRAWAHVLLGVLYYFLLIGPGGELIVGAQFRQLASCHDFRAKLAPVLEGLGFHVSACKSVQVPAGGQP